MSEIRDRRERRTPPPPNKKESKKKTSKRIEWARSLSNDQMDAVLQDALLKTRAMAPRTYDVTLLEEVVHEIKSRLNRYHEIMGDLPRLDEDDE